MKTLKKSVKLLMNQPKVDSFHQPVLLNEVIKFLAIKPGEVYIDATLGGAGHSVAILKKGGKVFGLDRDPEAVLYAKERLNKACLDGRRACLDGRRACPDASGWQVIQDNFTNLEKIISLYKLPSPAGILLDLGVSLHQFKTKGRGFSFFIDEPLDMRMDPKLAVTAAQLVNGLNKGELDELFSRLGEEKLSLRIAQAIIWHRQTGPIKSTGELARLVSQVYQRCHFSTKIHPATKVFQALRIAVNDELNNLRETLPQAIKILKKNGRLVVISFHGLEDKIVKDFFKKGGEKKWLMILTKKPVTPSVEEKTGNPRSRSAKLRACIKV